MLRAAAKNHASVTVVVDPADYPRIIEELQARGATGASTRFELAIKAFAHTARYDGAISSYLSGLDADGQRETFPRVLTRQWTLRQSMRYGENPHQQAALYVPVGPHARGIARAEQVQGKELSYNNLNDAASMLTHSLPRIDRILHDFEVFADKIARHPESLGVGGAIRPSAGLKEAPTTSHWRGPEH